MVAGQNGDPGKTATRPVEEVTETELRVAPTPVLNLVVQNVDLTVYLICTSKLEHATPKNVNFNVYI